MERANSDCRNAASSPISIRTRIPHNPVPLGPGCSPSGGHRVYRGWVHNLQDPRAGSWVLAPYLLQTIMP